MVKLETGLCNKKNASNNPTSKRYTIYLDASPNILLILKFNIYHHNLQGVIDPVQQVPAAHNYLYNVAFSFDPTFNIPQIRSYGGNLYKTWLYQLIYIGK